jgi:hypothetical protein
MDKIKNEYINFMQNNYKNIILKLPVFYRYEYALRFDLHKINRNLLESITDEYFIESLNRAYELFHEIFCNCNELYFIYRHRKIEFNDKIFNNITKLKKDEIHILNEENIYEENSISQLSIIKLNIGRINYKKILESINNTDFHNRKPITFGEIYFIHIKNEIIFNMYDDRGLDIVGTSKETIEPFYRKYNKWLLEYDREKMNEIFN